MQGLMKTFSARKAGITRDGVHRGGLESPKWSRCRPNSLNGVKQRGFLARISLLARFREAAGITFNSPPLYPPLSLNPPPNTNNGLFGGSSRPASPTHLDLGGKTCLKTQFLCCPISQTVSVTSVMHGIT